MPRHCLLAIYRLHMPRCQISADSSAQRLPRLKVHRWPPIVGPYPVRVPRRDWRSRYVGTPPLRHPPSALSRLAAPASPKIAYQRRLAGCGGQHNVSHTLHRPLYRPHASPRAVGGRGCHHTLHLHSYNYLETAISNLVDMIVSRFFRM